MKKSRLMQVGVGALMVTGAASMLLTQNGLGANVAYAQGGTTTPTATTQTTPPKNDMSDLLDTFWSALATNLNVSADTLKTQVAAAETTTIEQAVTDGKLTRAQADAIEQRLSDDPQALSFMFGMHGGPGGPPNGGAQNGRPQNGAPNGAPGFRGGFGNLNTLEAVAMALNLKPAELSAQLQSGKTLAAIATAQSVDEAVVKQAIVTAAKAEIQRQVTDGVITQAQADQQLANITVDKVDLTHPGGFGPMGRGPQGPNAPAQPSQ